MGHFIGGRVAAAAAAAQLDRAGSALEPLDAICAIGRAHLERNRSGQFGAHLELRREFKSRPASELAPELAPAMAPAMEFREPLAQIGPVACKFQPRAPLADCQAAETGRN